LLHPWVLTLFLAWFCPSLRLGPLALVQLWMHLLLFRPRLWLLSFRWDSIFGCTPLRFLRVVAHMLWLLLLRPVACMSTWSCL
jgi:hypothetical protein